MEIIWDQIDRRGWKAATAEVSLPAQQHWTYGAVMSAMGRNVRHAEIIFGGRRLGLAQVVSRRFGPLRVTLLSRGPVWLEPVAPDFAVRALRALGREAGLMIVTPEVELRGAGLIPLIAARHEAVIDLRPAPSEIRARLGGKWRNRLVRAELEGISVLQSLPDSGQLARLLSREVEQQRQRGYRALPPAFTLGWMKADPEGMILYEAQHRGRTIATMLVLLHRPGASYHIGWSGAEGRRVNAHQLLLWHVIRDLHEQGYRTLDLGDASADAAPGLARFKIGSGATVAPLGATMLVLPALTRPRS